MNMRKLAWGLIGAVGLSSAAAAEPGFFFKDGDRVVFLGDSITEQRLYTTYIEAYALTRFPDRQFTFRNVGWSGDTAWLRQRAHPDEKKLFAATDEEQQAMVEKSVGAGLARDVLPLKPTVVTIKFGMNDHSYQKFREDIFRAYVKSQTELVKVLKQNGARVALLTPQPIEEKRPDPDRDDRNLSLRKFSDGLKDIGAREGALYVDQFDPYLAMLVRERASNPPACVGGGDPVHPGPAGQTLMAWAVLKGLGAPALVSAAELNLKRVFRSKIARAERCRITNLKYEQGRLAFDRLDEALPMPVDERGVAALKLAPVMEELNRYELKVEGLEAARYEVLIDGESAGILSREELQKGCNLAGAAGPIQQQAQQVLKLVFSKNNLYFERWRNVQLKGGAPERLQELDGKIAQLEADINAARVPKARHFELKPVQE